MGLSQGEVLCWEMLDGAQAAQREWKLQSSVHPLSVIPCRTRTLAGAAEELYFAGGFQNCHRGKADFCSCSFPRSVIVHYSITVLKAKNKKSEEWIPVTFVNLLSSVNTAGFG